VNGPAADVTPAFDRLPLTAHQRVKPTREAIRLKQWWPVRVDAADAQDSSRRCGMPGRGCDQKSDVKHFPPQRSSTTKYRGGKRFTGVN
jgi:hypothetical protein